MVLAKISVETQKKDAAGCRISFGAFLAIIAVFGVGFAGLTSGAILWFRTIYTLTVLTLFFAAIAARHCGPFWYGFAIIGWGYFLIGFGPWSNTFQGGHIAGMANQNLLTSHYLYLLCDLYMPELPPNDPQYTNRYTVRHGWIGTSIGIIHCMLTLILAFAGGKLSQWLLVRRSKWQSS